MPTTEGELVKTPQGQGLHRRFTPPASMPEFEVETVLLGVGEALAWRAIDGPALLLVMQGEGRAEGMHAAVCGDGDGDWERLHRGVVLFVPANTNLRLRGPTPAAGSGASAGPLYVAMAHHNTSTRAG